MRSERGRVECRGFRGEPMNPAERLREIDGFAERWARLVLLMPGAAAFLRSSAEELRSELLDLGGQLERSAPSARKKLTRSISEALLDLEYVAGRGGPMSLRLGRRAAARGPNHLG